MIKKDDVLVKGSHVTELETFSKKVLGRLLRENIYPIPYYYSIYFFNMLEEQDEEFKKFVMNIIELENNSEIDEGLKFEQQLKKSFQYSKEIIKDIATIYKLVSFLKNKNIEFLKEIDNVASPQAFKNMLLNNKKTIESINEKISNILEEVKRIYGENLSTLKQVEKTSIFDSFYGVYNKKFFINEVDKEIEQIKKLKKSKYTSSIIGLKVRKNVLETIKTQRTKQQINRTIAKIMLRTSRRTDVVAYLGESRFGMLLRNTDTDGAVKTSERLNYAIKSSAMFVGDNEIEIEISIGISELKAGYNNVIDILSCVYDKIEEAEKENELYRICDELKEED